MPDLEDVHRLAEMLFDRKLDPVPRFRLLRDVLCLPESDPVFVECKKAVLQGKWVPELERAQEPNGIWGRFHSEDSSTRRPFPTTESAVRRALALGLDKDDELLSRATKYMVRHLQGLETWTDPPEKHEGWPVNIRFVTAGTLARIDRDHPILDGLWILWTEIVRRVFSSGCYDAVAEREAHRELNCITSKNKFTKLWTVYPLLILSSTGNVLAAELEHALLDWLWRKEEGIYYVYSSPLHRFPEIGSKHFPQWIEALETLSRFGGWRSIVSDAIAWIWKQQNSDGLWDFGPAASGSYYFPLSDSWRKPLARQIDCSTRVLALLRKYHTAADRP